jgi:glycosyltransferase involved in cell wall biosynthesis
MSGSPMNRNARPVTLLVTPHAEPAVVRLQEIVGKNSLEVFASNPIRVQGDKRTVLNKLRYYWVDPIVSMCRLLPRIHRYRQVICYYHRTGYWVGIYKLLFFRSNPQITVWVGFAPNRKLKGIKGWIKETLTRLGVSGHSVIICNSRPLMEAIKHRFPRVKDRLAFVKWGGGDPTEQHESGGADDRNPSSGVSYVFTGGRTNRDFETVLAAVGKLGCPAVFAVAKDYDFKDDVPSNVRILRGISSDTFQRFVSDAGIVVISLDRSDVSSGQVVLSRAMKEAKPIIVTKTAGIDDYVQDGKDALLVEPHDPIDLANKISMLLANKDLRQRLSTAARQKYESEFNSSTFARDILDVLSNIEGWR